VLQRRQSFFLQHTGDEPFSHLMTLQTLHNVRAQQASSLAYFDVFWASAALALAVALVFLVFLMKRSVAAKGEHIGAE